MKIDIIVALNEPVKLAVSTLVLNVSNEIQKKNINIYFAPVNKSNFKFKHVLVLCKS